jgi:hypothetical protein
MELQRITAYTVYANPNKEYYWIRMKFEGSEETKDLQVKTLPDLNAIVDLFRNETHCYYDESTQNVVIGWEATGENSPQNT